MPGNLPRFRRVVGPGKRPAEIEHDLAADHTWPPAAVGLPRDRVRRVDCVTVQRDNAEPPRHP